MKLLEKEILSMSRIADELTELSYQQNISKLGDSDWSEKQRVLLADMALHLLQTISKRWRTF